MNRNLIVKIVFAVITFKKQYIVSTFLAIILAVILVGGSVSSISLVSKKSNDNFSQMSENKSHMKELDNPKFKRYPTGFVPPEMDVSHLTGQAMPERYIYQTPPSSFDWRTLGKVTSVKNQSTADTCWAFASLGCFESKVLLHGGGTYDLSEDNVKECEHYHKCCNSSNFYRVANYLSQLGTVLESCDPYQPFCNSNPPCGSCTYQQTLLDWRIISGSSIPSTNVLKNYIYYEGPVYTSIWIGAKPYNEDWRNEFIDYDGSYTLYKSWSGTTDHAVLIVGWDDSLSHSGGTGGWICKNSWDTNWGDTCGFGTEKGYFTIAYGSAAIGKYSSYVDQWGKYDNNGGIAYYDEGGRNWGFVNDKTGWGLCKYITFGTVKITRVEFWTNDITTDIDVYLYDTFNGNDVSKLLWSSFNNTFNEAGYHGIAVVPPLTVNGGDDINVVLKITNKDVNYPIPADDEKPTTTGRTYYSVDGTPGSWNDLGQYSTPCDAAIRLRVSNNNPPNNPTISGENSGKAGTSYDYDFISTDQDGDKVSYYIKWGDGKETDWTPFQNSGIKFTENHTWNEEGEYSIEAKARDIYGTESNWTKLEVSMPKDKIITNFLLLRFFETSLS